MKHAVLYSYRRCPFAMRARMGLYSAQLQVEQREIVFWDKPQHMLEMSPKGTIPVLVLPDGQVIDESLDILLYALKQNDPMNWLPRPEQEGTAQNWIQQSDEFKPFLDHYKYADRFLEKSQLEHRQDAEAFLAVLEKQLSLTEYLLGEQVYYIDIAIFPFIRQFANVDKKWWASDPYPSVNRWLQQLLEAPFFKAIMKNRPTWQESHQALWLDEPTLQTRNEFCKKAESGVFSSN